MPNDKPRREGNRILPCLAGSILVSYPLAGPSGGCEECHSSPLLQHTRVYREGPACGFCVSMRLQAYDLAHSACWDGVRTKTYKNSTSRSLFPTRPASVEDTSHLQHQLSTVVKMGSQRVRNSASEAAHIAAQSPSLRYLLVLKR